MSLEQVIAENTQAIRELMALMRATPVDTAAPANNLVRKDKAPETRSKNAPAAAAEEAPAGVDYKQIQRLVPKIASDTDGTEMVKALFARYGAKRGPDLKPEQYDDFYADLVRVQAGEYDPREAEVE